MILFIQNSLCKIKLTSIDRKQMNSCVGMEVEGRMDYKGQEETLWGGDGDLHYLDNSDGFTVHYIYVKTHQAEYFQHVHLIVLIIYHSSCKKMISCSCFIL